MVTLAALNRAVKAAEKEREGFIDIEFPNLKAAKRSRDNQTLIYPDVRQEIDASKAKYRELKNIEKGGLPMAKGDIYKVVVFDGKEPTKDLITLSTKTRAWAGAVAKIAKENALICIITVPTTVKERTVKIAGLD